ncbi:hypothetical protein [Variovorax boronicumulans]|uniref:hypothetical protein n=1 Tax=Variovorax boronicumulans TaxID=436515 RepID=UPI001C59D095
MTTSLSPTSISRLLPRLAGGLEDAPCAVVWFHCATHPGGGVGSQSIFDFDFLSGCGVSTQEVEVQLPVPSARLNTASLRVIPEPLRGPGMTRLAREACRLPSNPPAPPIDFNSGRAAARTLLKTERSDV